MAGHTLSFRCWKFGKAHSNRTVPIWASSIIRTDVFFMLHLREITIFSWHKTSVVAFEKRLLLPNKGSCHSSFLVCLGEATRKTATKARPGVSLEQVPKQIEIPFSSRKEVTTAARSQKDVAFWVLRFSAIFTRFSISDELKTEETRFSILKL